MNDRPSSPERLELIRVSLADAQQVQEILDAAPTYLMNVEGLTSDPRGGGVDTLTALPPNCDAAQKYVFILMNAEHRIGVADLIRGYPDSETAFLGLLLLREDSQQKGLGRTFYEMIEKLVAEDWGLRQIRLGVVESNPVAPFWQKMGFQMTDIAKPHQGAKLSSTKRVMVKSLSMNIELSRASADLAEWWFEDRQDPETLQYNPLAPSTVESLRERLSKASSDLADYESADTFFWAIKVRGAILGHVTMQNINRMMRTAEIGYGVSRKSRGQGVATAVIRLLTQKVFEQTPIRKLIAFVHEGNIPSRKVLENVGFKQEGLLREHYLVNGEPVNEVIYGALRSDIV